MSKAKILIVEDEIIVAMEIQERLKNLGYTVTAVVSYGEAAIQNTEQNPSDLVLMDIRLKGEVDGVETAKVISERFDIPVIFLTAYADNDTLQRAKITQPFGYILKPFEERELHTIIEIALHRHNLERKLKKSEQWRATILKSIADAVIVIGRDGFVTYMNPLAESLTGWGKKETMGRELAAVFKVKDIQQDSIHKRLLAGVSQGDKAPDRTKRTELLSKNGENIPIEYNATPLRDDEGRIDGVVFVFRDITRQKQAETELKKAKGELELEVEKRTADLEGTNEELRKEIAERKKAEEKLKESLKEKELLLKEVHHRVKNNLQIVSSLLNFQSRYVKDRKAVEMFRESQKRIKSMAVIHEKLYQSKDLTRICCSEYIRSLVDYLFNSYKLRADTLTFKVDIEDCSLGMDAAIPCGMIINELITNSLEHAFPDGREGEILVSLHSRDSKHVLTVRDNGIGFPEGLDYRKTETLGLRLVSLLADQLKGKVKLDRSSGTAFTITFAIQKTREKGG